VTAELTPDFLVEVSNEARRLGAGVVLVHTHPNAAGIPDFSPVDDDGEVPLRAFFCTLFPARTHFAMVVGPDGANARVLGASERVTIEIVGREFHRTGGNDATNEADLIYDRQVRAFGAAGQAMVSRLRVAIVGLGGTGSVVAQELAHLGVGALLLIDPDRIEVTNLNRVVGSTRASLGATKVETARRMTLAVRPEVSVEALAGDVVDEGVAARLIECDFIFICTDSHASRAVVAQVAYQYLIPAIDIGVGIAVKKSAVASITGRVQMLAPGLPCLLCTDALDAGAIRRELLNEAQRAADPYFDGDGEPQPAVISLNATISSLAVTMFLAAMAGMPSRARHLHYDGKSGAVRPVAASATADCIVCSPAGALGRGVDGVLPVRRAS
jgi:molybdopterin/thiamine biosynthesis adenylyltransferase